jgi:hypothetical protein
MTMIETKDVQEKVEEQIQELAGMTDRPHERPASFPLQLFAIYLVLAGVIGLAVLFLLGII